MLMTFLPAGNSGDEDAEVIACGPQECEYNYFYILANNQSHEKSILPPPGAREYGLAIRPVCD